MKKKVKKISVKQRAERLFKKEFKNYHSNDDILFLCASSLRYFGFRDYWENISNKYIVSEYLINRRLSTKDQNKMIIKLSNEITLLRLLTGHLFINQLEE